MWTLDRRTPDVFTGRQVQIAFVDLVECDAARSLLWVEN